MKKFKHDCPAVNNVGMCFYSECKFPERNMQCFATPKKQINIELISLVLNIIAVLLLIIFFISYFGDIITYVQLPIGIFFACHLVYQLIFKTSK